MEPDAGLGAEPWRRQPAATRTASKTRIRIDPPMNGSVHPPRRRPA